MDISRFALAVLLLELTPGPNMAYLASLAMTQGRAAGLAAVLGVALGLSTHAVVAALGAGTLIQRYAVIYELLRWAGVIYLFYLAWEGWRNNAERSRARTDLRITAVPLFWRGFLTNVFNPKSILFFVSVVPTFVSLDAGQESVLFQMAVLGSVYVAVATGVHGTIIMLASQLQPWLVEGPYRRSVRRILSLSLALVAIWLAWTTKR